MKVDDYDIKEVPNEVKDFVDDVTTFFNNGKYSQPTVPSSPSWDANNGEMVFVNNAQSTSIGFYISNTWNLVNFNSQVVRAWVAFSGTGNTQIDSSVNVTSLTRDALGEYTLVWSQPFQSADYAMATMVKEGSGVLPILQACITNTAGNPTQSSVKLSIRNAAGARTDPTLCFVMATGVV